MLICTMGPFSAFKRYTLETHGRDAVIVELKGTTKKGRVPHVPRAGARVKQVPSIQWSRQCTGSNINVYNFTYQRAPHSCLMNKFICTRRQRLRLLSELVTGVSVRIRTWYFAGMRKYPVASRISKQSHVRLD